MERDFNPPLYYILLSMWIKCLGPLLAKCLGSGELILRSLSTVFGVFSILLIYKLGKMLFDTKAGLASAFILSLSPIHIWYSQEARGYSLSIFLAMMIVYFFISAIKNNHISSWIGFSLSSLLALLTNYFSFFIIFLVGITIFVFKSYRHLIKPYWVSLLLIFSTFLLFLPIPLKQIDMGWRFFWIPQPRLNSLVITFGNFNIGYNATAGVYIFSFFIFSLLFILGILGWWKEKRRELIFLALLTFIPIIVTFLISQKKSIYLDRQLLIFSPFYYIVIASGLARMRQRIVKIATYLSLFAPVLFCLHNYFNYQIYLPQPYHMGLHSKKPVKPAADYINARFREGDLVAYSDLSISGIFFYMPYISSEQKAYFFVESKFKNARFFYNMLKKSIRSQLERGEKPNIVNLGEKSITPGVKGIEGLDFKRVWLISSSWGKDGKLDGHVKAVREFMCAHYMLLETKEFDGIFIDLYCPRMIK